MSNDLKRILKNIKKYKEISRDEIQEYLKSFLRQRETMSLQYWTAQTSVPNVERAIVSD